MIIPNTNRKNKSQNDISYNYFNNMSSSCITICFVTIFAYLRQKSRQNKTYIYYYPRVVTRGYQYLTPMGYNLKIYLKSMDYLSNHVIKIFLFTSVLDDRWLRHASVHLLYKIVHL